MKEDIDILREIGVDKIHEDTYIAKKAISAILNKEFEKIHKVQFSGFIHTISKTYKMDCAKIKDEFREFKKAYDVKNKELFIKQPKQKISINFKKILVYTLATLFVVATIYYKNFYDENVQNVSIVSVEEAYQNNNPTIENTASNENIEYNFTIEDISAKIDQMKDSAIKGAILAETYESNISFDENQADAIKKFYIEPKVDLWIGIIDLKTRKKFQTITIDRLELNLSKDFIMITGHSDLKIAFGDDILDMNGSNRSRFIYENGEFNITNRAYFRSRNGGFNW